MRWKLFVLMIDGKNVPGIKIVDLVGRRYSRWGGHADYSKRK